MSRGRSSSARVSRLIVGVCASAALSAWGAPPLLPAVIVNPSAETRKELTRVMGHALAGIPVTLADDALTTSNRISLEHARPRDPAGRLLNGRDLSRPETFELFTRNSHCVLVHSRTGRAWTLHHVRCAPMPPAP
jgi:hypothetical protein